MECTLSEIMEIEKEGRRLGAVEERARIKQKLSEHLPAQASIYLPDNEYSKGWNAAVQMAHEALDRAFLEED